jgi:hypothetical protein
VDGGMGGAMPTPCSAVCEWEAACTLGTNCPTDCAAAYASSSACRGAVDAFDPCIEAHAGQCAEISSSCDTQRGAYSANCEAVPADGDSCSFAKDGACDDPGFCDAGTDRTDCASVNSCDLAYDGVCEEGNGCAAGTDTSDCS